MLKLMLPQNSLVQKRVKTCILFNGQEDARPLVSKRSLVVSKRMRKRLYL